MPRIISVIAQKGGVGKTTSTIHIATALANMGFKTLIIDWDTSQGNSTYSTIGHLDSKNQKGICHIIANGGSLSDVICETKNKNLYIIPSEVTDARGNSYSIESILTQLGIEGYTLLKELLEENEIIQDFQFIIIDNTPKLGIETVSSLIASDYFITPVQMTDFSLGSIGQTIATAMKVKKSHNKNLEPLGIFVSSSDNRINKSKEAIVELGEYCKNSGIHLFESIIPIASKFAFLPRGQQTIFDVTKATDRGHKEYLKLTKELLNRMMTLEKTSATNEKGISKGAEV
jgi:chromosome partitioning protein